MLPIQLITFVEALDVLGLVVGYIIVVYILRRLLSESKVSIAVFIVVLVSFLLAGNVVTLTTDKLVFIKATTILCLPIWIPFAYLLFNTNRQ